MSSINYSFLERTHLPKLPIPPLESTLPRYLDTVKNIASRDEYEHTEKLVAKFASNEAKILQEELLELDQECPTSYLEGFWNTMYLTLRAPLMINVSPFGIYMDDNRRKSQIERAASLLYSTARFAKKLEKGQVDDLVGMIHSTDLCVSQYRTIFSSRIPNETRDEMILCGDSRYVVICCRGFFYKVGIMDDARKLVPEEQLEVSLRAIVQDAESQGEAKYDVGILTTENRTTWARARAQLIAESPVNKHTIDTIDNALMVYCLDHRSPKNLTQISKLSLHSGNGKNRWFDKSLQCLVFKNGVSSPIIEHSHLDGDTHHAFSNFVVNDAAQREPYYHRDIRYHPKFEKLHWKLSRSSKRTIRQAEVNAAQLISTLDLEAFRFSDFGKLAIKNEMKISPNSVVQMAMQLAFYRQHLKPGSTYEPINMKKYYHGRTEAVRTVTRESVEFTRAFVSPLTSIEEKERRLRAACDRHRQLCTDNANGLGIDRHLYALHRLAEHREQRLPNCHVPEIFLDPLYTRMKTDLMTSSNMSGSNTVILGGFGAVCAEGIAVGYIMDDEGIRFCLSSYTEKAKLFKQFLETSLRDIRDVLMAKSRAKI
uniref:Choline/carnitine acyltransferase domain-containing protein n=1 Tax=Percolomonas cosmopolitus TaxID=63605 RepID=A0A7S1KTC4_9EUKA|mmetsp:Transcript_8837/g.32635  ORF Transcript_8837/g.32635 Transcript_8837/m.32635 type:complete len:597 (+) Transcript_8837:224-2014(+)|eukprot:CAMPEP_0117450234 /NCGR_PEP_ID=MMETSP0759-20121206/8360_1 /TAXON_ID=63605 /ORGANISM="Percolomonas cosmopolitus, Strain WS" /LENGTH=596 /DNA_ID=CAMNT_0005242743 /DNA_START=200 /DNA_END=1990 /DNA_ORIENTATION=+